MSVANASAVDRPPIVVEFWSDIGCPWASLAVHRFRAARTRLGLTGRVVLKHHSFPLELINSRGTPKDVLDAELDVLMGMEPGLQWQPWSREDWAYPVSVLTALEAVAAAQFDDVGGLQASEDLDAALRHAFYAKSRPIGLHTEIVSVAGEVASVNESVLSDHLERGSARRRVFDDWRHWRDRGVKGSPHLFWPDGKSMHNPGIELVWDQDDADAWHVQVQTDDSTVYESLLRAVTIS